jgi:hypothetical protein
MFTGGCFTFDKLVCHFLLLHVYFTHRRLEVEK